VHPLPRRRHVRNHTLRAYDATKLRRYSSSTSLKSWTDTAQLPVVESQLVPLDLLSRLPNHLPDTNFQYAVNHALVLTSISLRSYSMAAGRVGVRLRTEILGPSEPESPGAVQACV
jgi:hypothetical protein